MRRLIDCVIATVAIGAGVSVLHRNDNFDVLARHTSSISSGDGPHAAERGTKATEGQLSDLPAVNGGEAPTDGLTAQCIRESQPQAQGLSLLVVAV